MAREDKHFGLRHTALWRAQKEFKTWSLIAPKWKSTTASMQCGGLGPPSLIVVSQRLKVFAMCPCKTTKVIPLNKLFCQIVGWGPLSLFVFVKSWSPFVLSFSISMFCKWERNIPWALCEIAKTFCLFDRWNHKSPTPRNSKNLENRLLVRVKKGNWSCTTWDPSSR